MADARTEKQKVKEITDRLEEGLKELFEGEKYKSYLNTMSKFHNYSANNIRLIEMQCPGATYVAGYRKWQKDFGRHVNEHENGIRILAPAPYKFKEEREKIDPVTNEPVLDRDGMPVMEEVEIKIPAFRVVTVFDYSQTDGKELLGIGVSELHGDVERYRDFMEALERVSPVPIRYEGMEGDRKGYFIDLNHPISIKEGMSETQTAKTGVHEVAHAKLHDAGFDSMEDSIPLVYDMLNDGQVGNLEEWLNEVIAEGALPEEEKQAKELLERLAEYKPLAKVEELEECNYNMIDNVLNNEKPKEEKEKQSGRISIKEKLAEKKEVTRQRDKAEREVPEKGTEKKSEREI